MISKKKICPYWCRYGSCKLSTIPVSCNGKKYQSCIFYLRKTNKRLEVKTMAKKLFTQEWIPFRHSICMTQCSIVENNGRIVVKCEMDVEVKKQDDLIKLEWSFDKSNFISKNPVIFGGKPKLKVPERFAQELVENESKYLNWSEEK